MHINTEPLLRWQHEVAQAVCHEIGRKPQLDAGGDMELLGQLFSDWVGILSISTIVFILGMAVFIGIYVMRHVHEEEHAPAHSGRSRNGPRPSH